MSYENIFDDSEGSSDPVRYGRPLIGELVVRHDVPWTRGGSVCVTEQRPTFHQIMKTMKRGYILLRVLGHDSSLMPVKVNVMGE